MHSIRRHKVFFFGYRGEEVKAIIPNDRHMGLYASAKNPTLKDLVWT